MSGLTAGKDDPASPVDEDCTPWRSEAGRMSVVIVSHESEHVIGRTLETVAQWLPGAEIVVVENGKSTTALNIAQSRDSGVRTILCGSNLGFGAGCNKGASAACGKFILFLNPDAILVRVDERALRSHMWRQPFGVLAATGEGASGENVSMLRRERGWRSEIIVSLVRCLLKPAWMANLPLESLVTRGGVWASGAAFIVRRDEFLWLGGFDERLFLYSEDSDLSRRYRHGGYPIQEASTLVVSHKSCSGSLVSVDYRIACGLLSAIEVAEMWDGEGEMAAALAMNVLRRLDLLEVIPGRRLGAAARKSAEARAIRDTMRAVLSERPPNQYPSARRALAAIGEGEL